MDSIRACFACLRPVAEAERTIFPARHFSDKRLDMVYHGARATCHHFVKESC